jgi:hypothetical protein
MCVTRLVHRHVIFVDQNTLFENLLVFEAWVVVVLGGGGLACATTVVITLSSARTSCCCCTDPKGTKS